MKSVNKQDWKKLQEQFDTQDYFEFIDRLSPDVLSLLFNLNNRITKLEEQLKQLKGD